MQEHPLAADLCDVLQRTYDTYAFLNVQISERQRGVAQQLTQLASEMEARRKSGSADANNSNNNNSNNNSNNNNSSNDGKRSAAATENSSDIAVPDGDERGGAACTEPSQEKDREQNNDPSPPPAPQQQRTTHQPEGRSPQSSSPSPSPSPASIAIPFTQHEWDLVKTLRLQDKAAAPLITQEDLELLEFDLVSAIENIPVDIRALVLQPFVGRMMELAFGCSADCLDRFEPYAKPANSNQDSDATSSSSSVFSSSRQLDQIAKVFARIVRNDELFGNYVSKNVNHLLRCQPLQAPLTSEGCNDGSHTEPRQAAAAAAAAATSDGTVEAEEEEDSALRALRLAEKQRLAEEQLRRSNATAQVEGEWYAVPYLAPSAYISRSDLDSVCLIARPTPVIVVVSEQPPLPPPQEKEKEERQEKEQEHDEKKQKKSVAVVVPEQEREHLFQLVESVSPCGIQATSTMIRTLTQSGGLSNFSRIAGRWFPRFMETHDAAFDFIFFAPEGPLPVPERLMVALIAASRQRSAYMFSRFILHLTLHTPPNDEPTVKQWITDPAANLPDRLKRVQYFNALSTHCPWKITKDSIGDLIAAGYTMAQVFHICCILSTVHAANGLVQAVGLNLDACVAAVCPSFYAIDSLQVVPTAASIAEFQTQQQQQQADATSTPTNRTHNKASFPDAEQQQQQQQQHHSRPALTLSAQPQPQAFPQIACGGIDFEKYAAVPEIGYQQRVQRSAATGGAATQTVMPSGQQQQQQQQESEPSAKDSATTTTATPTTTTKDNDGAVKLSDFNFTDHCTILLNNFYPGSAEAIRKVNEEVRNMCVGTCHACCAASTATHSTATSNNLGCCRTLHELRLLESAVGDLKHFSRSLEAYVYFIFGVTHDDFLYASINSRLPRALKEFVHKLTLLPPSLTMRDFAGLEHMTIGPTSTSGVTGGVGVTPGDNSIVGGGGIGCGAEQQQQQQQKVISLTPRSKLLVAITASESRKTVELLRQLYAVSLYLQAK